MTIMALVTIKIMVKFHAAALCDVDDGIVEGKPQAADS